jgi:Uma2 family endonuclease
MDPSGIGKHGGSMGEPARLPHYTFDEYRRFEETANTKHEYLDGQILAMAGGTPEHAGLSAAVIEHLGRQLGAGPCQTFTSDLRVRVLATGLATYPDVTIVRGNLERDPEDGNGIVNPTVLVEVASSSTEHYDRGEKAAHYRRIPSLREYVFVSHRERHVERWWRDERGEWRSEAGGRGARLSLAAIGAVLDVDAIYGRSALTREL